MMRPSSWVVAALIVFVSIPAMAQPRGGGRGPGGFGGRGGLGGGPQVSALQLASNSAVQSELAMTEEQVSKIQALNEEFRAKAREGAGDFRALRELPEEERRERMQEMMAERQETMSKLNAEFQPKVAEVLDAVQSERLEQIRVQALGPQALQDETVVKALGLTQEQQAKIEAAHTEFGEKTAELRRGEGDARERFGQIRELSQARDQQINAVLTTEQQAKLEQAKGDEFDLAQLRQGRGRGGEGARPGQRGRGRGEGAGRGRPEGAERGEGRRGRGRGEGRPERPERPRT
jgi:Spy/CpxP family protein refolding chaperone